MHFNKLVKFIHANNPDLIHAHYGFSGLLANLQRRIPVVTTFHGSDINIPGNLKWSKLAHFLSKASIFVETGMKLKLMNHRNSYVIPCGVDTSLFKEINQNKSRTLLNLSNNFVHILFSSDFDNPIKNYPLAKAACDLIEKQNGLYINLIELKGLGREEVNLYLNASDCALLISSSEGSPQFIKEAMASNCPIISTNVGDTSWVIGDTEGCFLSSPNVKDLTRNILNAIYF